MPCVRIERLANGFTVTLTDPKIAAANRKGAGQWRDPDCTYTFDTIEKTLAFVEKNIDAALPAQDYDSAFADASRTMDKDKR